MAKVLLKRKQQSHAEPPPVSLRYVAAIEMEEGMEYVNALCNVVLTLKKVEAYEGPLHGVQALRNTWVVCDGLCNDGSRIEVGMWGTQPVLADQPEVVRDVKAQNCKAQARIAGIRGEKAASKVKVDAEGKPLPAKEKRTRGELDPRTGCTKGSQGHVLGTIMLDNKCGPSTREKCVSLMQAVLHKDYGFDERKAKSLAQSWYSTLWTRKAAIYQAGRK